MAGEYGDVSLVFCQGCQVGHKLFHFVGRNVLQDVAAQYEVKFSVREIFIQRHVADIRLLCPCVLPDEITAVAVSVEIRFNAFKGREQALEGLQHPSFSASDVQETALQAMYVFFDDLYDSVFTPRPIAFGIFSVIDHRVGDGIVFVGVVVSGHSKDIYIIVLQKYKNFIIFAICICNL